MNAKMAHDLYEASHAIEKAAVELTPLIVPQVNLNGTAAEELIEQQRTILKDFEDLMEAMAKASPHGSDFQTMEAGDTMQRIAAGAWRQRRLLLNLMRNELELYAIAINEQPAAARKRVQLPLRDEFTPMPGLVITPPTTVERDLADQTAREASEEEILDMVQREIEEGLKEGANG